MKGWRFILANFSRIARIYAWFFQTQQRIYQQIWVILQQELSKWQSNEVVLDLGCGTGAWTSILQEQGAEAEVKVIGIDQSPAMLRYAQKNGVTCYQGDVTNFQEFAAICQEFHPTYITAAFFLHGFAEVERRTLLQIMVQASTKGVFFIDFSQNHPNNPTTRNIGWKWRFLEWLEGSYYREFRTQGLGEMQESLPTMKEIPVTRDFSLYFGFKTE